MREYMLLLAGAVVALSAPYMLAAQAPPGTDIYLVEMGSSSGVPSFGSVTNVTDRAGYDNQPSCSPDGAVLEVADFARDGIQSISRIAVSPTGECLAIVGERLTPSH
jgi:hypothetical protein